MKLPLSPCGVSMFAILLMLNLAMSVLAATASPVGEELRDDVTVDDSAIAVLERAATRRDQDVAVTHIGNELVDKTLSVHQIERIATVLALTPSRQDNPGAASPTPGLIELLQSQQHTVPMSKRTITILAESLANDTIHSVNGAAAIASLIGQQLGQQALPSEALTTLIGALDHIAISNRAGAIDALSHLPKDDHRRPDVVEELAYVLSRSDHHHTRLTVIRALTRMSAETPLPSKVLSTVAKIASSDAYMTVRLEALEALEQMSTGAPSRRTPSQGNRILIRELLNPTLELWQKSQGTREHRDLRPRAIAYLWDWYKPKFPPDVIQVFINECKGLAPQQSLEFLLEIRLRDGLSDAQLFELRNIAANHPQPQWREAIYQLALPNLVQGSVVNAEQAFGHSGNINARLEAGHALLQHYRDQSVPAHVAGLASDVLADATDNRLREVAATLIAQSELPKAAKEQALLRALRQGSNDRELPGILLSMYDPHGLDELAQRHIEDTSLSMGFRTELIRRVGDNSRPAMSPELVSALRRTAEGASSNYYLIGVIKTAMKARGTPVPMLVTLKGRSFQSGVLMIIWLISLVITVIIGISAFIGILYLPFNGSALGVKRGALAAAWLAGTVVVFGFLAVGFVGFLGHNSAPAPTSTLALNLPLYAALLLYLPLGATITWRAWQHRR